MVQAPGCELPASTFRSCVDGITCLPHHWELSLCGPRPPARGLKHKTTRACGSQLDRPPSAATHGCRATNVVGPSALAKSTDPHAERLEALGLGSGPNSQATARSEASTHPDPCPQWTRGARGSPTSTAPSGAAGPPRLAGSHPGGSGMPGPGLRHNHRPTGHKAVWG